MASINLDQSYKNICKYCGLVKKSLVSGNFVCGKCKVYCEQQLSEKELLERESKASNMISELWLLCIKNLQYSEIIFLKNLCTGRNMYLTHQQYLSLLRIYKKRIPNANKY